MTTSTSISSDYSAVNSIGSVSTRVILSVNQEELLPPPIIVHGPQNQTLVTGTTVSMPCISIGSPQPLISWFKDGVSIIQDERIDIDRNGQLTIDDLQKSLDSGVYTCVASSQTGKSTWSGFLKLEDRNNVNAKFYRAPEASMFPGQPGEWESTKQVKLLHPITFTFSHEMENASWFFHDRLYYVVWWWCWLFRSLLSLLLCFLLGGKLSFYLWVASSKCHGKNM